MNYRRLAHGAKFWFWVALFVAYSAAAVGIVMIDTADHRYQPLSVKSTTVAADEQQRRHGASQVAAVYRASSAMPFSTLPAGSTFRGVAGWLHRNHDRGRPGLLQRHRAGAGQPAAGAADPVAPRIP